MFTTIRTIKLATVAFGTVALFGNAGMVFADTADNAPTAQINIAAVDFTSTAAVHTLKVKATYAAREVCYTGMGSGAVPSVEERACYDNAVHTAFARIDQLQVLALASRDRHLAMGAQAGGAAAR